VTDPAPLPLERPRDLGALLGAALTLYRRNFGTLFAIAFAVALTVNGIVLGVGLEQIWAEYDDSPSDGETFILIATSLITTPLIIAMTTFVLRDREAGQQTSAGSAIQRGLDVFPPLLLAVVVAAAGVALGLLLLVIPGIYLAIRWLFAVHAVVVEGLRGPAALERSGALVSGSWWRIFGIAVVTGLVTTIPGLPITIGLDAAADAADRAVIVLAGQIALEALVTPFSAILLTLLYFDLKAREREAPAPTTESGPPDPPGLPPRS
jgi:hypothetical protein